jgi:peptidyl-prolyl cis-trans isomerase C
VNGQPISQTVYNAFVAEQKAQGAPDSPELQNAVKEELVRREILAQEAKKKGSTRTRTSRARSNWPSRPS